MLKQYYDLLVTTRGDNKLHSARDLVQPDEMMVKTLAQILQQAPDPIAAAQDFVHSFTEYLYEEIDYWAIPGETLSYRAGDCDDKAILLCSILRNFIPAEKVFCAFGFWKDEGHMWVVTEDADGQDLYIESTASSSSHPSNKYTLLAMFNDQYAFATDIGIVQFGLVPVYQQEELSCLGARSL